MSSLGPWSGSRGAFDPFSFDVWDPLAGLGSWISDISGARRGGGDDAAALARANVDWRETSNAHIFTAEIPGVRKEEVKVAVEEGNILQISGERSNEEEEKGDTWHRVERRRGRFMRRFRLPDNAKMEGIKCKMENGVLTVEIPKQEAAARNIRAIDIS